MSDTQPVTETAVSHRQQVMRAAGVVGLAFLLSRLVGLVRDVISKNYLGLTTAATAYEAAQRFPESIFLIVAGGAIGSAFIPTFAAYFERDDEPGAWRLFSAVINLTLLATTLISLLTFLFARPFTLFFLNELVANDPQLLTLTVALMRVMLLSSIIFGASGVVMGTLNARQHFLLPALAPIVYNLGIILGAILWPTGTWDFGKEMGMALGTLVGALGHLLVQIPGLRQKQARYTPIFTLHDPGVRQVLKLMAPRVLGLSFSEVNKFATLFLSGLMPPETYPALILAWRIMIMPQGFLGQAMGTAAFPTLASLAARKALDEMRQILADSLRMLLFLGLPASILLMTLRQPIIRVLFERGVFSAQDTLLVAWALLFYGLGLAALTALEVISRAFYALNDTLTPVLAGGAQIGFMVVLSYWLSQRAFPAWGLLAAGGLALGYSLSNFLEAGLLLLLLRRKMGGLNGRFLLDGFWRMGTAGVGMAVVMELGWRMLPGQAAFWTLLAVGGLGGVIYLGLCWLFQVKEMRWLWGMVQRRGKW